LIEAADVTTENGKAELVKDLNDVKANTTDKPAQDFVQQEITELEGLSNASMLSFSALLFCVVMSF